ncbi:MAG: CPBP family intramembrane metalloprotease [Lachnospiraceae bacterium]|nr:CPBP family intramembrane metalloprotease [Lachnospiraceae bacterium]
MNRTMNSIGWKYGLMAVIYIVLNFGISLSLQALVPDFFENHMVLISYGMIILTVDLVSFPLVLLLTHNMPKAEIEKKRLGFGRFLLCVLIMYGLVLAGALIGMIFHLSLTAPFGNEPGSELTDLLINSNSLLRIFMVGVLAPIFEELIFRKVLIDHVAPKGELVAILASGIMFGLFHGNFQQCFFAAFIGCFFAYIYLKTGRIIYTILLHFILNTVTSGITVELIVWFYKAAESIGLDLNSTADNPDLYNMANVEKIMLPSTALILWVLLLLLIMFAGLVTFIVIACMKKIKINRKEEDDSFGKQALSLVASPCMWIFYVAVAVMFVLEYLPPILEFIKS